MEQKKGDNIYQKMSKIQGMNLVIKKNKKAHSYKYATLDKIMETLNPILHENGLLVTHEIGLDSDNKQFLETKVINIDNPNETITNKTYIKEGVTLQGQNVLMVLGSQITYFRRYHVTSIFGLSTEEDTDAGGSKMTSSKKSVDNTKEKESGPDFVLIFKNALSKNKTSEQVTKLYENYKSQMTPDVAQAVHTLISTKFNTKKPDTNAKD